MKRLAIFLDGTWNTLENNTNVWRLRSLCEPAADGQLVYYGKGVGTTVGERIRGGIAGYGIDQEILEAYEWIIQVFEPGDELFVFGFSRGAYAARSLSGLIAKCGVLVPGAPLSIQQLFDRYRRYSEPTLVALQARPTGALTLEECWMIKYCTATPIRFLGVWDTVGSVGSPLLSLRRRLKQYQFLDTHLRLQNEYAFHALALDEHRKEFEPTLWTRTVENTAAPLPSRPLDQAEQRWFVGAHANVGGGYPSDTLAQPPLAWIAKKARQAGLALRPGFTSEPADPAAPIRDSYAAFVPRVLRPFKKPFYRVVGADPDVGTLRTTSRINETIDASVFERWRANREYRPPSLTHWGTRKNIDPALVNTSVRADEPSMTAA
ncbi:MULTISPECIES: DUF2235 domain-containing protein [Sphingomonas]|uniref:DUF2235 domain-containing protein n=1 Tax=Sphingomonas TaxID=13687 RepID=UPI000DEFE412|nr:MULTISPECIES: DUF2235 domain-containing protein [Sphingomonas]